MPTTAAIDEIYELLRNVTDPEIPVLTIADIGILRSVEEKDGRIIVTITPTYSGCPAMKTIEDDIRQTLDEAGYAAVEINTILSPAWTTDWLSDEGRRKLEAYGIAPPAHTTADKKVLIGTAKEVRCPRCKSTHTEMKSQFGSTACKALYVCLDCKEPFDYFKCI
jgi:ring-1,2-phenylacetyl-CoA epoxidase subunit PaaD